jgi:hypothetical protein
MKITAYVAIAALLVGCGRLAVQPPADEGNPQWLSPTTALQALYVANALGPPIGSGSIVEYGSGRLHSLAALLSPAFPQVVHVEPDGRLYVVSGGYFNRSEAYLNPQTVTIFRPRSAQVESTIHLLPKTYNAYAADDRFAFDPRGTMFVAYNFPGRVGVWAYKERWTRGGRLILRDGPTAASMAVGSDDTIFLGFNQISNNVVTPSVAVYPGGASKPTRLLHPGDSLITGLVAGSHNELYCLLFNGPLVEFKGASYTVSRRLIDGIDHPIAAQLDGNENLYVLNSGPPASVSVFEPSARKPSRIIPVRGTPVSLAVDYAGTVYVGVTGLAPAPAAAIAVVPVNSRVVRSYLRDEISDPVSLATGLPLKQ